MSERRRKRRPGRLRRWFLRPLGWALAIAAVLALVLALVARSAWLETRLARLAEEQASERLARPVSVDRLSLSLLPLGLEVEGLVVGGRQAGEAPLAVVPRATVEASAYWRGRLELELHRVRLERAVLNLLFDPETGWNTPKLARRGRRPAGSRVDVSLEELTVIDGLLVVDENRLPLDLSARGVEGRLWGDEFPQWRADVAELELLLPRAARPFVGAVSARGRLDGRALEVQAGRVSGPDLRATLGGRLEFGADRGGILDVRATSSTALLERLGYLEGQLAGEFEFTGNVLWDTGGWSVQGAVDSAALVALDFPLSQLRAVVAGDRERWQADIQQARYAGGAVGGAVRIETGGGPGAMELDLMLDGVDFETLLADRGLPVSGVAATVSGPFSYRFGFGQADRGTGWGDLRVRPGAGEGLALRGVVPLLIERGVVRTSAARLVSGAQRLESSGRYDIDRQQGRFRFRLLSDRVEQLLPLLPIGEDTGGALWRPTAGRGELGGTLLLTPAGPSLELRLDLAEVVAPGAAADALHGSLLLDRAGIRRMRLELLRPDSGLIVTGSLPFGEPDGAVEAPFALDIDAAGWPLDEARVWLPFELPVAGPLHGALRLSGSLDEPMGVVAAELRPASVMGITADELGADLRFAPDRIYFDRLELAAEAGRLTAEGEWDRLTDELSLALAGDGLDLGRQPFAGWWEGELSGRLAVDGRVAGTLAAPSISGRLVASELALGETDLGEGGAAELAVDWSDGRLEVEGSVLGLVELAGGGRLDSAGTDLELAVAAPDLPALAKLFGVLEGVEFGGAAAGRLLVAGELGGDQPWQPRLSLGRLELSRGDSRLENLEPVELAWTDQGVRVDSLYLGQPGTTNDLFVAGLVGLGEGAPLNLRLQTSLDTAMAGLLLPGFDFQGGRFDMLASVRGTLAAPRINGQGEVVGARLRFAALPQAVDGLTGGLLFYPGQVVLDSVRGEFAGGALLIGGRVDLPTPERELGYRLQVSGRGVSVRYPEGWELRGDAELSVVSLDEGRQIRGSVTLDRALYQRRVQVGLTQLLQAVFQRRRQEVESADEELAATQLSVLIRGPDALRVRNNVANLRGDIDLSLRGSLARPVLFGRVELAPGGTLQVGGSDYTVERGFLTFANPYRMEPVIDLAASTQRRDYDLSLTISGTLDRLNTSLASDPPLADLDVLGLLATGEPTGSGAPALGAEAFLYGQAASLVTERVNRLFGLDRFRIDPLSGSGGSLSSARVTVGKQLSRDVLATYSYDPSQTEQQILQLEWSVARGLVLVVTQNGDGTYAVDARWEKSF